LLRDGAYTQELQRLLRHAPVIVFALDLEGRFALSDGQGLSILGLKPGEMVGRNAQEVYRDCPQVIEDIQRAICGEAFTSVADAGGHVFETYYAPLHNAGGELVGTVGVAADVTARSLAQRALLSSEQSHRAIFEHSHDAIFVADPDGTIQDANPAACALVGRTLDQLRGTFHAELHPAESREQARRGFRQQVATPSDARMEIDVVHRDGRRIPVEISTGSFTDVDGQQRMFGIFRDISETRLADERLRETEQRFSTLFESMAEIVVLHEVVKDAAGRAVDYRILDCNPAFTRGTGISRADAVNRLASQVYGTGEPPYLREYSQVAQTGNPCSFQAYFAPLDRHFQISVVPTGPNRFATIAWDISEIKRAQKALAEAKEVAEAANAAKDQFLATLSHELRTPLTPVTAILSSLDQSAQLPAELRADVQLMRRHIDLEAHLIGDLLDLTRITRGKLGLELKDVDAHEILRHAIAIPQAQISEKHLGLELQFEAARSRVRADPTRLQQVFWNIVQNAVNFTPRGGRLLVRTSNTDPETLQITFSDTGIGIDPAFLPRLFDAFEQDRGPVGARVGGLGLGMAISRSLMALHGGTICAYSEGPGKGATFTVSMHLAQNAAVSAAVPAAGPLARQREMALRILLVEDHASTLQVISKLLRGAGHQVFTAQCLGEAVDIASKADIDLLISDIGLPDGSGLDLPRMLGDRLPPYAIALSGYGMDTDLANSKAAGFSKHLVKPVPIQQLLAAIQEIAGATAVTPGVAVDG
jgi:PAS domain S-box-containing protein